MMFAYYDPVTLHLTQIKNTQDDRYACPINNELSATIERDPSLFLKYTYDPFFNRIVINEPKVIEPGEPLVVWKHISSDQFKLVLGSDRWLIMMGHDRDHLYIMINRNHRKSLTTNFNQPFFIVEKDHPDWHRDSFNSIRPGIMKYRHWGKNHRVASHFISPDVYTTDVQNMSNFFELLPLSD